MPYRKGLVLSWGLLNVIVSIDGALGKEESLTTVCCGTANDPHVPTQINQVRRCKTCAQLHGNDGEVAYGDLKKARKVGNEFQVADQQEIAAVKDAALGATKKMLTLTVHEAADFDAQMLQADGVYYVAPDGPGQIAAYNLLLDALKRHPDKRFVTRFTPSSAPSTWVLKAFADRIVIEKRCDPEQVRPTPAVDIIEPSVGLQDQIDQLIGNTTVPFDPATYRNEYAEALNALMQSKQAVAGEVADKAQAEQRTVATAGVVDLSATLAAMLQQQGSDTATPITKARRKKAS